MVNLNMAENANKNHGSWKSRKARLAAASFGAPFIVSSVAFLILDKMSASEWINFNQFLIPMVLGIYGLANVSQKIIVSKTDK